MLTLKGYAAFCQTTAQGLGLSFDYKSIMKPIMELMQVIHSRV